MLEYNLEHKVHLYDNNRVDPSDNINIIIQQKVFYRKKENLQDEKPWLYDINKCKTPEQLKEFKDISKLIMRLMLNHCYNSPYQRAKIREGLPRTRKKVRKAYQKNIEDVRK
ncbi:MAG: hypothetical protein KAK00_05825 [Nanoarchaeota archaeon]|nr:hypothetical protein [Nanoarchaeota archaeon]